MERDCEDFRKPEGSQKQAQGPQEPRTTVPKIKWSGICYQTLEAGLLYQRHGLIPPYHRGRYIRPRKLYLEGYIKP